MGLLYLYFYHNLYWGLYDFLGYFPLSFSFFNTLRTGDADFRFYITTVQDE